MYEEIKKIEKIQGVRELAIINEEILKCLENVVRNGHGNAKLQALESRKERLILKLRNIGV